MLGVGVQSHHRWFAAPRFLVRAHPGAGLARRFDAPRVQASGRSPVCGGCARPARPSVAPDANATLALPRIVLTPIVKSDGRRAWHQSSGGGCCASAVAPAASVEAGTCRAPPARRTVSRSTRRSTVSSRPRGLSGPALALPITSRRTCVPPHEWADAVGFALIEPASLAFDEPRIAGGRRVEQSDVLVVGLVRLDQAGAASGVDGCRVNAEPVGELADGEQTVGAEPFVVAGEAVGAA